MGKHTAVTNPGGNITGTPQATEALHIPGPHPLWLQSRFHPSCPISGPLVSMLTQQSGDGQAVRLIKGELLKYFCIQSAATLNVFLLDNIISAIIIIESWKTVKEETEISSES